MEEKVEIQFGDISSMSKGRSRMLDLIGVVNSIVHPLLAPNTSHQALWSFDMVTGTQSQGKCKTSDFNYSTSGVTESTSPQLPPPHPSEVS